MTFAEEIQGVLANENRSLDGITTSLDTLINEVNILQEQLDIRIPSEPAGRGIGVIPSMQLEPPTINLMMGPTGQGEVPPALYGQMSQELGYPPVQPRNPDQQQVGGGLPFMNPNMLPTSHLPPGSAQTFADQDLYPATRDTLSLRSQLALQSREGVVAQEENPSELTSNIQNGVSQLTNHLTAIQNTPIETNVNLNVQAHVNTIVTEEINLSEAIENLGGSPNAFGLSPTI